MSSFIECSLVFRDRNRLEKDHPDEESLLEHEKDEEYRTYKCILSFPRLYQALLKCKRGICNVCTSKGCRKCIWCSCLFLLLTISLLLLLLLVAFPFMFKSSIGLQRSLIFQPITGPSYLYNTFNNHYEEQYRTYKKHNRHILVNEKENIKLGVWDIKILDRSYGKKEIKSNLLYFHSEVGDRRSYTDTYFGLGDYFNVTAFDYRSYGDSSVAELLESGLLDDSVSLYQLLKNQTDGDLYIMGDKIGSAIATHLVAKLKQDNIVPTGLILIHPFPSLSDKISEWYWPIGKIFFWMPWYDYMITYPLQQNDLSFNTGKYITQVDCPIMIIHTFYTTPLAEKVALIASNRDPVTQGTVVMHQTWWSPADHYSPSFSAVKDFIDECKDFKENKGKL